MDVPKGFKPKEGLEEKTKQLIVGPLIKRPEKIEVKKGSELDVILEEFYNGGRDPDNPVHGKIDSLLEKNGYTETVNKKLNHRYWTRKSCYNPYETDVFIRRNSKDRFSTGICYDFAIFQEDHLEGFYKKFERYHSLEEFLNKGSSDQKFIRRLERIGYASALAGAVGGVFAFYHYLGDPILATTCGIFSGALGGYLSFIVGLGTVVYSSIMWRDKSKKKMKEYCEELIIHRDEKAITSALN